MRSLKLYLLIAAWLFISAFVLGQTPLSLGVTLVVGICVGTLALVAVGKPQYRFVITAIAVAMGFAGLLLPNVSGAARLNLALVAPVLFALSLVRPTHGAGDAAPVQ
jgi:hypothetical protein